LYAHVGPLLFHLLQSVDESSNYGGDEINFFIVIFCRPDGNRQSIRRLNDFVNGMTSRKNLMHDFGHDPIVPRFLSMGGFWPWVGTQTGVGRRGSQEISTSRFRRSRSKHRARGTAVACAFTVKLIGAKINAARQGRGLRCDRPLIAQFRVTGFERSPMGGRFAFGYPDPSPCAGVQ
jgi:hypothetical protein